MTKRRAAFSAVAALTGVAVPVFTATAQAMPGGSRYAEQWDLFEATRGTNVPGAWETADSAGVTVTVIDTGITPQSDLNVNVLPGYDFITRSPVTATAATPT